MEFNDKQMKAMEIYLKSKDKMLVNPNYELSSAELQAKFMVENDPAIQKFLNDEQIKKNESIYSTMYIKSIDLNKDNNTLEPINQMGYANIVLMSIIVIILISIICVFIFL